MSTITFKGTPINTIGNLPEVGKNAQEFTMVAGDLSEKNLADYTGKRVVLNIFPSIDTGICAASARKFNEEASALDNTVVINVSRDLPFALSRFCAAEGLKNVETLSDFRGNFGEDYGVTITDSAFKGLLSRAVVVLDEKSKVIYTEQVPEIGQEPNYEAATASLK
ncbi:thiol peroxidase (atypical 2-Cys peroxiredoxin) [Chryseobacterium piscicola]|uniref:Thiol peroxidase n=1 Tax=Chryseobacterium piscicola TaxID=551459 RepID=A0A1N7N0P3_9FLAO|nr:thiol peroxidase [Chryseobacterium piscicola]PQA93842.1 lipid hydroperoxide peroxidase [Chryseobacterium piscicola]SIS91895.1 thiol peroxidase (atypical 2-Cys peroxiredoxin) [Chryseobacterium piscicola]